jgi:hypothetical protein
MHGLDGIDHRGPARGAQGGWHTVRITDDTEISNQLSGELGGRAGSGLLDDADKVVTGGERQWPQRSVAPRRMNVSVAGAGSKRDADLAGLVGNCRLFRQFWTRGRQPGRRWMFATPCGEYSDGVTLSLYTSALGRSTHR